MTMHDYMTLSESYNSKFDYLSLNTEAAPPTDVEFDFFGGLIKQRSK